MVEATSKEDLDVSVERLSQKIAILKQKRKFRILYG